MIRLAFVLCLACTAWTQALPAFAQAETRIKGADIMKHAIGPLAVQLAELIHAGRIDDVVKMTSSEMQARYRKFPASERTETATYLKSILPSRAQMEPAIAAGGVLIIEGNKATLNIVRTSQRISAPGTVSSTSETSALPFVLEGGQWRVAAI